MQNFWKYTRGLVLLVNTKNRDLWEGLTPEVRDSKTSRHSARQSKVWQIYEEITLRMLRKLDFPRSRDSWWWQRRSAASRGENASTIWNLENLYSRDLFTSIPWAIQKRRLIRKEKMYMELCTVILIIHNCACDFQQHSWTINPSKITDNSHHGSSWIECSWIEQHQPWNKHNPWVSNNSDIAYKYLKGLGHAILGNFSTDQMVIGSRL